MKAAIHTDQAPQAIGPYSQAIKANGFLFVSGQIPLDPKTGELVSGGVTAQTRQVLKNLQAILNSEGLDFTTAVKTTVFLKDMNDFGTVNDIYAEYFLQPAPARACVQVGKLPKDVSVEIEVIAAY